MIFLKKHRENVLMFLKDVIACYNCKSNCYTEYNLPQLQSSSDQHSISSVCISKIDSCLAVALSNKQLVIFDNEFNILSNTISKRAISNIKFTPDNDLLIADKTGDVFLYKWKSKEEPKLLLGHLSMLLDIDISECGNYVVTADRDEKIRVSHYPNAYNIVSFCLGHREFVTNIVVHKNVLISASGDGTVRLWNYCNGEELASVNSNEYVVDKGVIGDFCEGMNNESVDVQSVPITDMQMFANNDYIHLGITVLGVNGVQLYMVDIGGETIKYLHTVTVSSALLTFLLTEELIILTSTELSIYNMCSNTYVPFESHITHFFNHCKHLLTDYVSVTSSVVTSLYKRKYDNVQEYLEKKKIRIEKKS